MSMDNKPLGKILQVIIRANPSQKKIQSSVTFCSDNGGLKAAFRAYRELQEGDPTRGTHIFKVLHHFNFFTFNVSKKADLKYLLSI